MIYEIFQEKGLCLLQGLADEQEERERFACRKHCQKTKKKLEDGKRLFEDKLIKNKQKISM